MSNLSDNAILIKAKQIILANIDKTFPPDGVDLIEETLNGSKEAFKSDEGKAYITQPLTRFSSFLGLPNRKLHKKAEQSWAMIGENFLGTQETANAKRLRLRLAIMLPLNVLATPLRLATNILKIATEIVPGVLADIIDKLQMRIISDWSNLLIYTVESTSFPWNLLFGLLLVTLIFVFVPIGLLKFLSKSIYLSGCCLTSAFETLRSAWQFGINSRFGKPLAYFLCGACILTSIIMMGFALPLAAKLFAAKVVTIIAQHLPNVILNSIDKVAHFVTPALTAIGKVFSDVILVFVSSSFNIPFIFGLATLLKIPALVGASLFVATPIATIGPTINAYINDFKAWWNYDPIFADPLEGEGDDPCTL